MRVGLAGCLRRRCLSGEARYQPTRPRYNSAISLPVPDKTPLPAYAYQTKLRCLPTHTRCNSATSLRALDATPTRTRYNSATCLRVQ
eukprot:2762054-Rhodomonas_salina.2